MLTSDFETRPYQEEDFEWFLVKRRGLLLYERRLGKTVVSCKMIAAAAPKTVLILCPLNALNVWRVHLKEWLAFLCPERTYDLWFVRGTADYRISVWKTVPQQRKDINIYLTTYGSAIRDMPFFKANPKIAFKAFFEDEAHRIRSDKSAGFKFTKLLAHNHRNEIFVPMTGSASSKGPQNLFTMLHCVNKEEFSSKWQFESKYCEKEQGFFGTSIVGVKNPHLWKRTLDNYARIRYRADVRPQMPKIKRVKLPVDMTPSQLKMYDAMDSSKFYLSEETGAFIVASTELEMITKLRQIFACPRILDPGADMGGAYTNVIENILESEGDERHMVIFSTFKRGLVLLQEELKANNYNDVFMLSGGLKPELQADQISRFRKTKGVMLCTTKFAEAFSLEPAVECRHVAFSWDPSENEQAEDRLLPQEGENPILSYYYCLNGTIEDRVEELVVHKNMLIKMTLPATQSDSPS